MPDAIVVGAAKAGTTALFAYLGAHPAIVRAQEKELHFFDTDYGRGIAWYRAQFPTFKSVTRLERRLRIRPLTCEGTPYYLAHPLAPYRVRGLAPEAKLIALLRDPADRAISHHNHNVQIGVEPLPLHRAIAAEDERLRGETERIRSIPLYRSFNHQHYSYLLRGRYADQLELWFSLFPRRQFLILDSASFFADPRSTLRRVCEFLEVPPHSLPSYEPIGARTYSDVDANLSEQLREYFAPHNERLWNLLGEEFSWS